MNASPLNLRYHGPDAEDSARFEVEVYHEGQFVVHTAIAADGGRTHLISSWGGPHAMNTLHQLEVQVVRGPCTIATDGQPRNFKTSGRLRLSPGASFTVSSEGPAQLLCVPQPGPGLGSQGAATPILR